MSPELFGAKIREAIPLVTVPKEEREYRPLGRRKMDLPPFVQREACRLAHLFYLTNPLAHRIIKLQAAFITGPSLAFEAPEQRVRDLIHRFWHDRINAWDKKLQNRIIEFLLYGEAIYPVSVNPVDGFVRHSYLNPMDVVAVYPNAQNPEILDELELAESIQLPNNKKTLKIIRLDTEPKSKTFGFLTGETFFFTLNRMSDATRGSSELLPLIDWLGYHEEFMFDLIERAKQLNAWFLDVTLEDFTQKEIEDWVNAFQSMPSYPGVIRAHNQKVTIKPVSPSIEAAEMAEAARMFREHIASGGGFPDFFLGGGPRPGRGVVTEVAEPTFKTLASLQQEVRHMIEFILEFVIDQAILHKTLPQDIDREFTIRMPRISLRDLQRAGGAIYRCAQGLRLAQEAGWLLPEEARKAFQSWLDQLSVVFRPEEI